MNKHLFYAFLAIFCLTALVTLGGIIHWLTIDDFYLKGLFSALLLQLIGSVIALHKRSGLPIENEGGAVKKNKIPDHSPQPSPLECQIRYFGQSISPIIFPTEFKGREVRFSLSGVFRIRIDERYLLVRGNRFRDQFQPVGGVYKYFDQALKLFDELHVTPDLKMRDNDSRFDLRVRVPFENKYKFLDWFWSCKHREITPWREFVEELVETNILPGKYFGSIKFEHLKTHVGEPHYSEQLECVEVLIADVFDTLPDDNQKEVLKGLISAKSEEFIWVDASSIKTLGFNAGVTIGSNAKWLL